MVTRRTTSKAKAAAMLKSFEADYKTACKTKNPQMLEKYFEDLSDDHLKQLCNSANIDARKRETRVAALAAALLERKTTVKKALRVMNIIVRSFLLSALIIGTVVGGLILPDAIKASDFGNIEKILFSLIFIQSIMSIVEGCIKTNLLRKTTGTTKNTRRLLSQMRALHTVRAPSKTKKSS
jgi:hypothetical protein